MRDLTTVIDQMLVHIPTDTSEGIILSRALKAVKSSILYVAPEAMPTYWDMVGNAINNVIVYPASKDWHFKVLEVWTKMPVEEIKKL